METCTVGSEGSAVKPSPAMDQGARRLPYNRRDGLYANASHSKQAAFGPDG